MEKIPYSPEIKTETISDKNLEQLIPVEMQADFIKINQDKTTGADQLDYLSDEYSRLQKRLIANLKEQPLPESALKEYFETTHEIIKNIPPKTPTYLITEICKSAENLEENKLFLDFLQQWNNYFSNNEIETNQKLENLRDLAEIFNFLSGANTLPKPIKKNEQEMREIFINYCQFQKYLYNNKSLKSFHYGLLKHNSYCSGDTINETLEICKSLQKIEDQQLLDILAKTVNSYSNNHGLTKQNVIGFINKLLPAIKNKDEQIKILLTDGNIWGMFKDDFGLADFICHSYLSPISSKNLNELLIILKDIPGNNSSKLEQNRKDAVQLLTTPFSFLREIIHDQRPHIHELIESMLHFQKTKDDSKLLKIIPLVDYFSSNPREGTIFLENSRNINSYGDREIKILNNLFKNTTPEVTNPPTVSNQLINEASEHFAQNKNNQQLEKSNLTKLLSKINEDLELKMSKEEIGIEPNYIMLLSWLEQECFHQLQRINFEEQTSTYKQDWFISVLNFNELINSFDCFNQQKFNEFIEKIKKSPSSEAAYKLISERVAEQAYKLAKDYKQKGKKDSGTIWSGNIVHELIGLTDYRQATTKHGQKFILEQQRQKIEPNYHPGD